MQRQILATWLDSGVANALEEVAIMDFCVASMLRRVATLSRNVASIRRCVANCRRRECFRRMKGRELLGLATRVFPRAAGGAGRVVRLPGGLMRMACCARAARGRALALPGTSI